MIAKYRTSLLSYGVRYKKEHEVLSMTSIGHISIKTANNADTNLK